MRGEIKMRKLKFSFLLMALLVFIVGCGAGNDSKKDSSKSNGKTTMTVATLTGGNNEIYAELIGKEISSFNENNKFNVELVQEAYSNEQYKTKLTTLMSSNAQPDIFFTFESGFLQPFVDGGKVYPISEAIEADQEWSDRYPDKSIFGPVTIEDKFYAVPNTRQLVTMTYNTQLFKEAGVSKPTTYQEFLDVCKALKSKGITPLAVPAQEAWYSGQLLQQLANIVGGEELFNGTVDGTIKWNDKRYVKAGEMLQELVDKEYLVEGFLGMTPNEAFDKFNKSEVGMMMNLTSAVTMFNDKDNPIYDDIDFFRLPADEEVNQNINVGSTGQMFAVSSQAKNIEAASAFIKQLTEKQFQQELVNLGQVLVTNTEVDYTKTDEMSLRMGEIFTDVTLYTPWLDRIFGAGEGVEFNNAAVAIMAGGNPQEKLDDLQQFALDNSDR